MTLPPFFQFFFSIPVLEGWWGGWGWGEVVVLRASLVTSMLLRQCWSWANSTGKIKHNTEHSVFTFFYFETWTHNEQLITGVGEVQWGVGGGRMVTEKLPQRIFDYIQNKTKQSKTSWLSHVTYMLFRLTWTLFFFFFFCQIKVIWRRKTTTKNNEQSIRGQSIAGSPQKGENVEHLYIYNSFHNYTAWYNTLPRYVSFPVLFVVEQ